MMPYEVIMCVSILPLSVAIGSYLIDFETVMDRYEGYGSFNTINNKEKIKLNIKI